MASSQLAARAVQRLHAWLARGIAPRHVLVVTPSWSSAKFMEALIDTALPLGAYEVNVRSEDALASEVVATHAPQLRRNRVAPAVTRALLQRVLPSLPLPAALRPKHDTTRHVGEVYALFRDLAASGVTASDAALWAQGRPDSTADQAAVMASYAEWLATKERFRMADKGDVLLGLRAITTPGAPGQLQAVADLRDQYRAVLVAQGDALSPCVARSLVDVFGVQPSSVAGGIDAAPATGDAGSSSRHLHVVLSAYDHVLGPPADADAPHHATDVVRRYWMGLQMPNSGGSSRAAATVEVVPRSAATTTTTTSAANFASSPAATAAAAMRGLHGVRYVQHLAAGPKHTLAGKMVCVGADQHGLDVVALVQHALAALPAGSQASAAPPLTLGLLCKSNAQATAVHALLNDWLHERAGGTSANTAALPFRLASDVTVRLSTVEETVMLWALLRVLVRPLLCTRRNQPHHPQCCFCLAPSVVSSSLPPPLPLSAPCPFTAV